MILKTVKECDSTQEIAINEIKTRPNLDAIWVRSLKMLKGRGRRGRSWHCLEGNLFLSGAYRIQQSKPRGAILESTPPTPQWPFVSLIMAHALAKGLEELGYWKESFFIKWPNDLWSQDSIHGSGKIGGILSEIKSGILVVGMGLNTVAHPENNPEYPALDLAQLGAWNEEDSKKNEGPKKDLPAGEVQTAKIALKTSENFDDVFKEWLIAPDAIQAKVSSDLWERYMKPLSNFELVHLESNRLLKAIGLDSSGALKCIYKDSTEETLVMEGEVALVL
ncbi:hypothetical protein GW915_13145 [bacterium]|nr:hypothetical protein [bacterium]